MRVRSAVAKAACWILGFAAFALLGSAQAAEGVGQRIYDVPNGPHNWQVWMQPPVSPIMERIESFHLFLVAIITVISLFVLALLLYVMIRFNARRHPVPSRTSHNTLVEVIWTVLPVMILVSIAIPSFRLLYAEDRVPDSHMTVKVTGYQWYWNFAYPDNGNFAFDSLIVEDADLKPGQPRLLTANNPMVLPVNTNVRFLVTAADVIHSFALPVAGVKMDGEPGRLNETWFRIDKVGTYYGQCSELCGSRHAFMPIEVHVVSRPEFDAWVAAQRKNAKLGGTGTVRLADTTDAH